MQTPQSLMLINFNFANNLKTPRQTPTGCFCCCWLRVKTQWVRTGHIWGNMPVCFVSLWGNTPVLLYFILGKYTCLLYVILRTHTRLVLLHFGKYDWGNTPVWFTSFGEICQLENTCLSCFMSFWEIHLSCFTSFCKMCLFFNDRVTLSPVRSLNWTTQRWTRGITGHLLC